MNVAFASRLSPFDQRSPVGIVIESATAADHRNLDHGLVSFETEYFASDAICEKARAGELFQPTRLVTVKAG